MLAKIVIEGPHHMQLVFSLILCSCPSDSLSVPLAAGIHFVLFTVSIRSIVSYQNWATGSFSRERRYTQTTLLKLSWGPHLNEAYIRNYWNKNECVYVLLILTWLPISNQYAISQTVSVCLFYHEMQVKSMKNKASYLNLRLTESINPSVTRIWWQFLKTLKQQ